MLHIKSITLYITFKYVEDIQGMPINNVFNVISPVCTMSVSTRGMPRKIGFVVLSSSGHEGNFCAEELMVHAPTVHGWRSAR